ncbi:MAG: aminotransferase class I/II-fold pyridoxal phosphate-dependent enzyme [Candidatus Levybacteria bacterium]|nr:aminotransferase class I/II-fold pyridoxal phosphate-dependent enzyme [Candidatus Levybacteria bacterium]
MDKFYKQIEEAIKTGKSARIIESGEGAYLTIGGKKKLNFCSSHYLGLSVDPRLAKAASDAARKYGIGTGYRTLAGNHVLHLELEDHLARFKHAEAAVIFTGGYMANCAAIQTIIGKEDIVISDELNHASIIDAIRLSQVKNKFIYKHLDMVDLEEKLKQVVILSNSEGSQDSSAAPQNDNRKPLILIVTDGVFSMDGDLAPLPDIVRLARQYGALTMVDDAHGEGVLGKGGRGIVDHYGIHGQIDIEVGTLSKAFSTMGGFITGRKELITYYKQKARQYLFSNALTIPDTAALIEGVKILEESDELVKKLWDNTKYIKEKFADLGFDIGHSKSPITPVMIPDEDKAREFSAKLFELDVFATPIVFPMVPKGKARIRVIPSASHSKKDLEFGIGAFKKVAKELSLLR